MRSHRLPESEVKFFHLFKRPPRKQFWGGRGSQPFHHVLEVYDHYNLFRSETVQPMSFRSGTIGDILHVLESSIPGSSEVGWCFEGRAHLFFCLYCTLVSRALGLSAGPDGAPGNSESLRMPRE